MSEMETDHGFTLCDPDGNALAAYVSSDDREVRHGLQFMQAATDEALGVMPPGPS